MYYDACESFGWISLAILSAEMAKSSSTSRNMTASIFCPSIYSRNQSPIEVRRTILCKWSNWESLNFIFSRYTRTGGQAIIIKCSIIMMPVRLVSIQNQNQMNIYIFSLIIFNGSKHRASIVCSVADGPYL